MTNTSIQRDNTIQHDTDLLYDKNNSIKKYSDILNNQVPPQRPPNTMNFRIKP